MRNLRLCTRVSTVTWIVKLEQRLPSSPPSLELDVTTADDDAADQ